MKVILLMLGTFAGYFVAYHTYGRFLARRIFRINSVNLVPSHEFEDGHDYVPTHRNVIFGHHFTSIAGTGPIVGPAIGIIWGWVPALLWVFVGSIVMGAVHDFGTLVISLRNKGLTISECAAIYLGRRARYIFFAIIFLELLVVIAIFGLVIAVVFKMFPTAVIPVWFQIPIAMVLGRLMYQRKMSLPLITIGAVVLMYFSMLVGSWLPLSIPAIAGIPATGIWTVILLIYVMIASTLPVTALLQPRDYINAWQLMVAMGLLVVGVLAAGSFFNLTIVAPAFNLHPAGAPPMWPFLFITIACGAISGFHSLVSSGTSSKQLNNEKDARYVGYGSMLMEAALATLVIIAVAAGIGMAYKTSDGSILAGTAAWQHHYASWSAGSGLPSKISAVVTGSANMLQAFGLPESFGIVIIGVFIASFASTTLDTATRVQRYAVSELFLDLRRSRIGRNIPLLNRLLVFLSHRYPATLFAVLTAGILAFATGADGKGALTLWPILGSINQLLAALGLLLITNYLHRRGGFAFLLSAIPCIFMLVITLWSLTLNEIIFVREPNIMLAAINGLTLLLAGWLVAESGLAFVRIKEKEPDTT